MAIDSSQLDLVKQGISGSDSVFYPIAAFLLTIVAGFWGFEKVRDLLRDDSEPVDWEEDRQWFRKLDEKRSRIERRYVRRYGQGNYDKNIYERTNSYS